MRSNGDNWKPALSHAEGQIGLSAWASLTPVGVATFGPPAVPTERLIGTQAAVYRLIVWLAAPSLPRIRLSHHEAPRPAVALD